MLHFLISFRFVFIDISVIIIFYGHIRCVPSQSTATIKLELLPLTDGIITLDTLQIDVKEKGKHLIISAIFVSHASLSEE